MTTPNYLTDGPVGWQVIAQRETSKLDTNGQLQQGYDVTFRTTDGDEASVFVPLSHYSADTVRRVIADRASLLGDVRRLSSD